MGRRAIAIAVVALVVGVVAGYAFGSVAGGSSDVGTPARSSSPSPVHLVKVGGVFMNERHDELTPEMEPYPFTTPIPAREPTPIDGTYRLQSARSLHDRRRPDPPVQRPQLLGNAGDLPVGVGRSEPRVPRRGRPLPVRRRTLVGPHRPVVDPDTGLPPAADRPVARLPRVLTETAHAGPDHTRSAMTIRRSLEEYRGLHVVRTNVGSGVCVNTVPDPGSGITYTLVTT